MKKAFFINLYLANIWLIFFVRHVHHTGSQTCVRSHHEQKCLYEQIWGGNIYSKSNLDSIITNFIILCFLAENKTKN